MSKEIDKILAMLDLMEIEQLTFLNNYPDKTIDGCKVLVRGEWRLLKVNLPGLAFRLRDEAKSYNWNLWLDSTKEVWRSVHKYWTYEQFWMAKSKPIHWIIAALIAKQLAKEKNDKAKND